MEKKRYGIDFYLPSWIFCMLPSIILRLLRKIPTILGASLWRCSVRLCGNVLLPTQSEHSTDEPEAVYS